LATKQNRFGTTPNCFLTASSSGREAAGAASIVAGVGMREMKLSFQVTSRVGRTLEIYVLPKPAFLGAYPDIDIRMVLADRAANLLEEHIDLAVRIGELPDSSLVAPASARSAA
jgi:hypothetical protein